MNALLLTVFLIAGGPDGGGACSISGNPNTVITVSCENVETGKWFQAVIDRVAGTVTKTTGRAS